MLERTCTVCGKVFYTKRGMKRMCSPECQHKRILENKKAYADKNPRKPY